MKISVALTLFASGFLGSRPMIRADAFLDANGVFTTINVPGAVPGSTQALGVNDLGQIVGEFANGTGTHGFLDSHGVFTTLDFPGKTFTEANGINDAGKIVGTFFPYQGNTGVGGFLYANGSFSQIMTPGYAHPEGISNAGEIVGWFNTCFIDLVCTGSFTIRNGAVTTFSFPPPNFDESTDTFANGINNSGKVVGDFRAGFHESGITHITEGGAFLYNNGVFTRIDVPFGGGASGINDAGQIVGSFQKPGEAVAHGFLDNNGVFTRIDVPGAAQTFPESINNFGDIVGIFTPTPEPAALLLLGAGLAIIGFVVGRRRVSSRLGTSSKL